MGICVVSTRLMWISQDDTMYTRGASWLALKCYSTQDLTGVPVPWCDVTRPQPGTDYSPPCLSKGVLLLFDYIEGELLKWKESPQCTLGGGIIPADLLRPCRNFSSIRTIFCHLISINQLATITNAQIINDTSCETIQIFCQKCCHSDSDCNTLV